MDMTGKSQDEVVAILRNTKRGSTVTLCVSRVDTSGDSTSNLPRQMVSRVQEFIQLPEKRLYCLKIGQALVSGCQRLCQSLLVAVQYYMWEPNDSVDCCTKRYKQRNICTF